MTYPARSRRRRGPAYGGGTPAFPTPLMDTNFLLDSYRSGGASSDFDTVLDFNAPGLATFTDSSGGIVWNAHNLVLNSEAPATQTITVTSGADYTVAISGAGSVALSGAGTGSVTDGSPVEITASSSSLTLTVTAPVSRMWAYRSDLGGMADNPDNALGAGFEKYVPATSSIVFKARRNAYDGATPVGMRFESEARTNLLLNTATLSTQSVTVTAAAHTLSFYGTGTVTLSGASTAGPLVGTGANDRVELTFTPTAGSLTLTVSGSVTMAQLEVGTTASSYIPTFGSTVTRAAETISLVHGLTSMPAAVSIAHEGRITYADNDLAQEAILYDWAASGVNFVRSELSTATVRTGQVVFLQRETASGLDVVASANDAYSPGINIPFSIASRHGATFINGAVDGAALTENATPTAFADLIGVNISIASTFMGYIGRFRLWGVDIGDSGLEEVT